MLDMLVAKSKITFGLFVVEQIVFSEDFLKIRYIISYRQIKCILLRMYISGEA